MPAPPPFTRYETAQMRICQRNGWTLRQWAALADAEKDTWMAWDAHRQQIIAAWRAALIDREAYTPEAATALLLTSL